MKENFTTNYYYAVFNNGGIIEDGSLENISIIPGVKYFLKRSLIKIDVPSEWGNYMYSYEYDLIDKKQKLMKPQVSDFIILEMSGRQSDATAPYYRPYLKIKVLDKERNIKEIKIEDKYFIVENIKKLNYLIDEILLSGG